MEKVYKLNKKRMIIYLLIFLLASTFLTYMSIENTMKYKKVLEKYDDSVKNGNIDMDMTKIFEKMNYNRDHGKYSFRIFITIIICVIELTILYVYFVKDSKIVIDEEGIKVYSLYKRKPENIYPWNRISHIKLQYGDGIRGLISEYGMKIGKIKDEKNYEEVFIPIERLLNYDEISRVLIEKYPNMEVEVSKNMKKESNSIIQLLKEAYLEYKSDFGSYMTYSFIIFIFALLNAMLKNQSSISLITSIANIYFGYRAKIAMNYKAYMSYRGEKIDFDMGWNYAKSKMGRYFGANMIIGLIYIVFIGIEYLCLISDLGRNYKIVLSAIVAVGGVLSICRLYLITYIASIVDTDVSYMSLNGSLIKKYYKKVGLVVVFYGIGLIPIIIIGTSYYKDLYAMKNLLTQVTCINILLNLFVGPYVSCFIMKFLGELPVSSGGCQHE